MKMIKRLILILMLAVAAFQGRSYADGGGTGSIIIYGDSRTDTATHQKIVNRIMENNPAIVFHTGDLVEDGDKPEDWVVFNRVTADLRKKAEFFPVLGNHEKDSPLYFNNFQLPDNSRWYSVDRQGVHFIVLDSDVDLSTESEQYRWLEDNLKGVHEKTGFLLVLFHHPIFSSTDNYADAKDLRHLVPLFEKYGVDMVFNGHAHNYERFHYNNIYYIVTGGGGAPLYGRKKKAEFSEVFAQVYHFCRLSRSGNRLTVTAIDIDSNVVDEFTVEKGEHAQSASVKENQLEGVGFKEEAPVPGTDFKHYAELYIYGIDMRGMVVKRIDVDGAEYNKSADNDTLSGIAFDVGGAFSDEIGKVLPVAEQTEKLVGLKELKGKHVLILDIKLSYERKIEDVGALTQFLLRKKETMVSNGGLTIECSFRDADSGKQVLKLSQTLAFDVENNELPFSGERNQEELRELINIWAQRTARILAGKRGAGEV